MTKKIKIAIADDHSLILKGIRNSLHFHDNFHIIAEFNNGADLISFLKGSKPDLVITDYAMPILDGRECVRIVKENWPGIRMIMLSQHLEAALINDLVELGVDGFVSKAADAKEILEAVREVLRGKKYFDAESARSYAGFIAGRVDEKSDLPNLTPRELEIVKMIAGDMLTKQIASNLGISKHTVDSHRKNLLAKMEVNTTGGLVKKVKDLGFLD